MTEEELVKLTPVAPEPPGYHAIWDQDLYKLCRDSWRYGWAEGYRAALLSQGRGIAPPYKDGRELPESGMSTTETVRGNWKVDYVIPTGAGGTQLEWHRDGFDIEITFDKKGRLIDADVERGIAPETTDDPSGAEPEPRPIRARIVQTVGMVRWTADENPYHVVALAAAREFGLIVKERSMRVDEYDVGEIVVCVSAIDYLLTELTDGSADPPRAGGAEEQTDEKTFARHDQPQLRACEADLRGDDRG